MKKHLSTVILVLVFLAGLGLVMYPTVSDLVNKAHQSVAIDDYEKKISNMTKDDFHKILEDARLYNHTITTNEFPRNESDLEGNDEYKAAVNPSGNGMIGYLKIDSIKLRIPIYHTTKESVLQKAVGHIPTTSLPVGGKGTHAVLTGHRGLPSARLFTDLDKVRTGDIFYIYVLDDILAYKVDLIKTVLPAQVNDLQIVPGKDYVTLVTCTPYGINTHRLIVRGERVPYEEAVEQQKSVEPVVGKLPQEQIAVLAVAPVLVLLLIIILILKKKKRRNAQ
ncbi:MAG: class C sortase [Clostridia bacterium]|nr:class C sortase [Clostridia bacterium]